VVAGEHAELMGDQAGQQSGVALRESESPWRQCGTHLPRLLFTTFNEAHQRYVIVTVTIAIASLPVMQA
jgi:hypothetical protein